ncbi:MAG: hypothetical protein IJ678_00225 [Kiritimatiellae bacterium]|nr:hypothetical protein [Kiritimatiellia bacterium]
MRLDEGAAAGSRPRQAALRAAARTLPRRGEQAPPRKRLTPNQRNTKHVHLPYQPRPRLRGQPGPHRRAPRHRQDQPVRDRLLRRRGEPRRHDGRRVLRHRPRHGLQRGIQQLRHRERHRRGRQGHVRQARQEDLRLQADGPPEGLGKHLDAQGRRGRPRGRARDREEDRRPGQPDGHPEDGRRLRRLQRAGRREHHQEGALEPARGVRRRGRGRHRPGPDDPRPHAVRVRRRARALRRQRLRRLRGDPPRHAAGALRLQGRDGAAALQDGRREPRRSAHSGRRARRGRPHDPRGRRGRRRGVRLHHGRRQRAHDRHLRLRGPQHPHAQVHDGGALRRQAHPAGQVRPARVLGHRLAGRTPPRAGLPCPWRGPHPSTTFSLRP